MKTYARQHQVRKAPGMMILAVLVSSLIVAVALVFGLGLPTFWEKLAGDADQGRQTLEELTRTGKPNDALLGPADALPVTPDGQAPVFALPAQALFETITARVTAAENKPWAELDETALYARMVTRTPRLKFPDTTHVWVLGIDEATSTLVLYSAAQLGYSDLDKNAERLQRWLALLEDLSKTP